MENGNAPKTSTKDLTGQVIVITGANTGIGKETARFLARTGATVILACRDATKAQAVVDELTKDTQNNNIVFMKLDLSELAAIRAFVEEFKSKYQRLDILINNAAIIVPTRQLTKDGFELQFGTNHIGHFYLTNLLLDVIKSSAPSRIITVASNIHDMAFYGKMKWDDLNSEKSYNRTGCYGQSKLANVIHTKELQRRLEGTNVKVVCLHPGVIRTTLNDQPSGWFEKMALKITAAYFSKTPAEGAQTSVFCALEDHEKLQPGAYYSDSKVAKVNPEALKPENWTRLWEETEKMIASKTNCCPRFRQSSGRVIELF